MKQLTLNLSDAQHARLTLIAGMIGDTPERLAIGEIFAAFDGWSDDSFSFLETLESVLEFADTGAATRGEPGLLGKPGLIENTLPDVLVIEQAKALAGVDNVAPDWLSRLDPPSTLDISEDDDGEGWKRS